MNASAAPASPHFVVLVILWVVLFALSSDALVAAEAS